MITHSFYLSDPRVRREAETLARTGHTVDVICLRRTGERRSETVNGVTIVRMPLGKRRGSALRYIFEYAISIAFGFVYLTAMHLRRSYEVVHVHTPPDGLVLCALFCKISGAAVLLDLHDPMPEALQTKFGSRFSPAMRRMVNLQEQLATKFADHVITVTEQVREAVVNRGLSADRISIVMNLADQVVFDRKPSQIEERSGPPTIVYMGTLTRQYGVDIAIDALALLRTRIPEIRLRVIGDGEEREALEAQAKRLSLDDAVEFVGPVPITQIPQVALPAHVGVAPHRRDRLYDMCFPSKIFDYLSLGLPVVACRTDSLDYYYGDAIIAFFDSENAVELADRIEEVLTSPIRCAEMQRKGRAFIEKLNWTNESQKLLATVEQLAK